jgi:signal transduction histidine kinase
MNIALHLRPARWSNSLAARHLMASLVPLAVGMACVLASQLAIPGSRWAALWGLATGVCLGVPVAWSLAGSLMGRIRFARAKADLVAGDAPPVPGDDLDHITARIDHIARQLRDRQAAMTAAEQSAQQAADTRTEFLATMNHELRTPLNAILGFGQVLDMSPSLQADDRESLTQVLRAGRHLLRLVNELLQMSEAQSGQADLSPEPVQGSLVSVHLSRNVEPCPPAK